jgi:hypothetical protein
MKLVCPDCGPVDACLLDGYQFGDRILEGVNFRITTDSKKLIAETLPEDEDYMSGLNKAKWLREAATSAFTADNMTCEKCGEDGCYMEAGGPSAAAIWGAPLE